MHGARAAVRRGGVMSVLLYVARHQACLLLGCCLEAKQERCTLLQGSFPPQQDAPLPACSCLATSLPPTISAAARGVAAAAAATDV